MSRKQRSTDPDGVWKYSYGEKPHTVFAMERRDRGNQVFVKWTNPDKPGRHDRDRRSLGLTVRDPRTGKLEPRLVKAAELAVRHFQAALLLGRPTVRAESPGEPTPVDSPSPSLTLHEGFDLALDPAQGKYASTRTRRYDDMLKYRRRLFEAEHGSTPLLEPSLCWDALEPKIIRSLWRTMADRNVLAGGKEFGVRAAEQIVDAVYSVAAWLREEHRIPSDVARPPKQWRKMLKEEWAQRTGVRRVRPSRPRHTAAEYRRIFAALADARVDPRIRLAIELAAECRTGQALHCTRTMLTLTHIDSSAYATSPPGQLGQIIIPGAGKKHGETVVFTPEQRRAVDDALRGYLANYEAAWRAGQITDYYLFPNSRMRILDEAGRRWTRRVREGAKPMSRDGARVAFQELEKLAGVPHVPGRGWYGLRRIATDLAETATTDDRVKDRLGGWQGSETRKQIYQDRMTQQLRTEAASVRREIRLGVGVPATPDTRNDAEAVDLEGLLERLTPEQRALLAERLEVKQPAPAGPSAGPKANAPESPRDPARLSADVQRLLQERATGLEPATSSLGSWHSTN